MEIRIRKVKTRPKQPMALPSAMFACFWLDNSSYHAQPRYLLWRKDTGSRFLIDDNVDKYLIFIYTLIYILHFVLQV